MKFLMVLAPLLAVGLSYLFYKREKNLKKFLLSLFFVGYIVAFAIVGNIMRSIMPLFLTHLVAIAMAYGALLYYIVREKLIGLALVAPLLTMLLYLILVWVGNEHLPMVG